MKIILIVIGIIVTSFIIVQLFAFSGRKNIESYPYQVKKKYKDFEIRNYEANLFTSVKLSSNSYKRSSKKGFSILAGYIFGDNDKNKKIAMTSPVAMTIEDSASTTMMFMVPRKFNKKTLPKPNQSQIYFVEEPSKTVAAIQFSGWANDEKIERYQRQLKLALDMENISYSKKFYFFGYNPPYEVFNRKNEVIVELN
ncbi:MAG: heme-binding protein [Flavobacteriales bacterium]|nr:MAG: heme-binding protein [Flavobacteriales bacterium]